MTHLKIEQNNSAIEQVSSAVISKLYELANNNTFDNTSDLIGRLSATAAYADEVSWLNTHYQNLYITADKLYIRFEDPAVEQICVTNFSSDGVGCTVEDLAAVTSLNNLFKNNADIVSFNEFRYFTSIQRLTYNNILANSTSLQYITLPSSIVQIATTDGQGSGFFGCSSLKTITIPDNCIIGQTAFKNCTALQSVYFGHNCDTSNANQAFNGCTNLSTVVLNEINSISNSFFNDCSSLTSVVIPNTVTYIGPSAFGGSGISSLTFQPGGSSSLKLAANTSGWRPGVFRAMSGITQKTICLPERLSQLIDNALGNTTKINFIFITTTPPTVTGDLGYVDESWLYVPNSALATYQSATGFSNYTSRIKGYKIYQYTSSAWSEVSSPTEVQIMTAADNILDSTPTGSATDGALALVIQS